ncbi:MAG: FCD domain-containing protein [Acidaminococcus sp.]|nr:FCD domain-containing protein [Acidaminococcus sp.]MCI2099665.1 FCD domain-containing protein [Acidaminococcus sp.]MCI2113930.1 FCD domain-containing protein [Acidaminococcus sp.]MCI2115833.1 FCD domain-containing protein [Acidaminococcus sp.]
MRKKEKLSIRQLLETMSKENSPVGAIYLSHILNVPSATVGRMMKEAENEGLIASVSNKGRCLTEAGKDYLHQEELKNEKKKIAYEIIRATNSTQKKSLEEILVVRILLETYTVREACKNLTDEDLKELEYLTFEQQYKVRNGGTGSEADLQYHLKLAELSHNSTIYKILKLILTENSVYQTFTKITNVMHLEKLSNHVAITDALKERDADKAAEAMKKHLQLLLEHTRKYSEN